MTTASHQDDIDIPADLEILKDMALANSSACRLIGPDDLRCENEQSKSPHGSFSAEQALGLLWGDALPSARRRLDTAGITGLKLMVWQAGSAMPAAVKQALWEVSRKGIWNHLVFSTQENRLAKDLLAFALNNPNIVHSYSFSMDGIVTTGIEVTEHLTAAQGYARVKPLPVTPLWKTLATPETLLHFLGRFGRQQVQQWVVMKNGSQVHRIGQSIVYAYRRPHDLPDGFMDEICRMVEAGGSVSMQKVRHNLERAFLIGYAMEFDRIVGNSSLKHPRKAYIERLNRKTGLDFTGYLERGYTSVRPEYRGTGIGTRLLEGLTKRTRGKKLYSIITEDNVATQKIAIRNRTRKVTTFLSEKIGKEVGVWVKD